MHYLYTRNRRGVKVIDYEATRKACVTQLDAFFEHLGETEKKTEGFYNLIFIRSIFMDPPQQLLEDATLKGLVLRTDTIISMFDLNKMDKTKAGQLFDIMLINMDPDYCSWFSILKATFNKWPKLSRKYYPRTGQDGCVEHLVEYLELLIARTAADDNPILPLKGHILRLQKLLLMVSGHLVEIPEQRKEDVDLKILMEGVTYLAYDTEYAIDLFLVREIPLWYSVLWIGDIQDELKGKLWELSTVSGDLESIISQIRDSSNTMAHFTIALMNNIEFIERKLDVITESVNARFDIRTWSVVSSYKERKKEVFLQLLLNASRKLDMNKIKFISNKNEKELIKELVYLLRGDIHNFIILKDVDDIEDLDDILKVVKVARTTVLLTTCSPEVIAHCRTGTSKDLFMAKMSEDRTSTSQQRTKPTIDHDVLGFETETVNMIDRLTGGPKQVRIISIFGMAGQGKTTLAKKLYNDLLVVNYFDTRAWACVSQVYLKRELLLELLSQVVQLSERINCKSDEELAGMLFQSLSGRRFLIVLDDLWDTEAWNDLRRCFPDPKIGSRIIFTTRQKSLASKAQSHSMLQPLNPLSDDESWALLQKKLFGKESCPLELSKVGKKIAKYCKGLPLSVVLTAGLLKKMEKREDVWNDIAESLSSHICNEDEHVIELSYKHLQDHLKPCFLYFGAFLEDREVSVQKLIRLWIAEGFIKRSNYKSLEEVAEDYLEDLIGRSLVIVAQEKSNGGVKSCRVHDLLREFALTKATQDNFLLPIPGYDEQSELITSYIGIKEENILPIQSGPSSKPVAFHRRCLHMLRTEPKSSCSTNSITYSQRRLCLYSKSNQFFNLRAEPLGPHVRSLLFFGATDISPSYSYDISFIFRNFKLLKILNFEDINIGNSFKDIDVLLHLRYLAVQGTMVSVPSSIENLIHLETLCIKSLEDKVVEVPDSIWNLTSLRHLHITGHPSFHVETQRLENSFVLDNLQTLSTPSISYGDDIEKILRKLRGLQKLNCIFLDSWNDSTNFNQFPMLEFLDKLDSLKVFYNGERRCPCEFNFPSNLKKLTLNNFHMPWNEILQLARLHNLEVLKLVGNAFDGERWEMEYETVFPKLKFLKLDSLNVVKWIATGDKFPHLEHLILQKCQQLEEIPPGIGEIDTLLKIEVMWCNSSVAFSAKNIQEEQMEYGNEGLKIHVHPKLWDLESPRINK